MNQLQSDYWITSPLFFVFANVTYIRDVYGKHYVYCEREDYYCSKV